MQQKNSNRVLSIFNILVCVFNFIYVFALMPDALEIKLSLMAIYEELEESVIILGVLYTAIFIANVINIIINRKNKKFVLWSIIPAAYFLYLGLLNNLEIISTELWAIVPVIVFIIALITELRNDRNKKSIVFYILGIIMTITLLIIGMGR